MLVGHKTTFWYTEKFWLLFWEMKVYEHITTGMHMQMCIQLHPDESCTIIYLFILKLLWILLHYAGMSFLSLSHQFSLLPLVILQRAILQFPHRTGSIMLGFRESKFVGQVSCHMLFVFELSHLFLTLIILKMKRKEIVWKWRKMDEK